MNSQHLQDAPYIAEAERYGTEKPTGEPLAAVAAGLASARDKVQEALAILRQIPDTSYDEQIAAFDNAAELLEMDMDALACALQ